MFAADFRLQSREHQKRVVVASELSSREVKRHPYIVSSLAAKQIKVTRKNTDHREGPVINGDGMSDEARIRCESALPEAVADEHDLFAPRLFFFRKESAPRLRLDAKQFEKTCRRSHAPDLLRIAVAAEPVEPCSKCRDMFEHSVLLTPVGEVRRRNDCPIESNLRIGLPNIDQSSGVLKRRRSQQDSVNNVKDRGVCSNTERERDQRDRGEHGFLLQHPRAVAQVLPDR